MKKGDKVKVYTDPITKRDFEGEAKLLNKISESAELEYWDVEFVSDGFRCPRFISKRNSK